MESTTSMFVWIHLFWHLPSFAIGASYAAASASARIPDTGYRFRLVWR